LVHGKELDNHTLDNLKKVNLTEKEFTYGKMEINIKVNLLMD